jgi:hypothetical protein
MNSYIHRDFVRLQPAHKARLLAEHVYRTLQIQIVGERQVRIFQGRLRTYPFPAPRGYGTRGVLVGIYTLATRLEWIEEDFLHAMGDTGPCTSNDQHV